ncbi:MAG TPA: RDD family protein [Acholeplasmataceae bacterium]|nr:RDD family protein [Acholeplasmataceae bacterium]HQC30267.1 RDD family protein [Acholeplasmataceae bacterium]
MTLVPSFEKIIKSFAIDTSGVMLVVLLSIPMSDPPYLRGALIGAAFIGFYFFPYFLSNGQTFGKRVEKIKVVDASGVDARIWRLLLRQLFMLVASIITFGIYFIVCFFFLNEKKGNRLPHDYIFRTRIIDIDPPKRGTRGDDGFNSTDSMRKRGF